jgi:hypothetical protein
MVSLVLSIVKLLLFLENTVITATNTVTESLEIARGCSCDFNWMMDSRHKTDAIWHI